MSKSGYFDWLVSLVKCDTDKYGDLMRYLFEKEFYWTMPMDENRSADGKGLRDLYFDGSCLEGPCTVLEMIIALSRRWQIDICSEDGSEEGFEKNFWEIIGNLGLNDCTNDNFIPEKVNEITTFMLDRDYSGNGIGGLFPVYNENLQQNQKDIWYQLQAYLAEKEKLIEKSTKIPVI